MVRVATDDKAGLSQDERDLQDAADEFTLSEAGFSTQRTRELADLKFESGDHFEGADLSYAKHTGKPAIVMDQVSGQVAKVTNQPVHRIVVIPNGHGADPESAEFWQGYCRRVETLSSGEDIYKYGRLHVCKMGRGFWRVRADYFGHVAAPTPGQPVVFPPQDVRIENILHQHSVHPDPRCRNLDFSDARFCIITSDLEWSEFTRLYPGTEKDQTPTNVGDLHASTGDCPPEWGNEKTIRVAERYYIVDELVTLCQLVTGEVVVKEAKTAAAYPKEAIAREHTFRVPKVKWMKYIHGKILERAAVPGRYIPVVMIVGERRVIDGKHEYRGMVRMAKDPQRLVNFYESRLASAVDLGSEGVWLASTRAVPADRQPEYANAHKDRPAVLFYDDMDESGQPIPPPQFVTATPGIQHLVLASQRASMALRGVLGVPDVTPEETRPEQSGKAIGLRQREQAQATSHYADSTAAGIRHTARIIMSMAREILDVPQMIRIAGKDEKEQEIVTYKGQEQAEAAQQMAQQGLDPQRDTQARHTLDISVGEFDVTVTAGKGYQSGRQEAVETLTQLVQAFPPIAPKAIPAMLKNSDFPGAQELAASLAPPEESGMVPVEQLDAIKQQAGEIIDQAKQEIARLTDEAKSKRAELDAKVAIARDEQATQIAIERIKIEGQLRLEELKGQIDLQKAHIAAEQARDVAAMQPQPVASPEFGA